LVFHDCRYQKKEGAKGKNREEKRNKKHDGVKEEQEKRKLKPRAADSEPGGWYDRICERESLKRR
jgi:hypothetical protein